MVSSRIKLMVGRKVAGFSLKRPRIQTLSLLFERFR